jgi:DNA-binding beta-propeller fold protein YncE
VTFRGRGIGAFRHPKGVAVDHGGHLFVADTNNFRILELSTASGDFLAVWMTLGSVLNAAPIPGMYRSPRGVAVDSAGNVYVADTFNHRIQKLSPSGEPLAQAGIEGDGLGQLSFPSGVAVDRSGRIYVADTGNNRLQRLTWPRGAAS